MPAKAAQVQCGCENLGPFCDSLNIWTAYSSSTTKKISALPSWNRRGNVNLGFSDLVAVLTHISIAPVPSTSDVKDVSRGKIEANLLSQAVADFLKIGMWKSPLVAQFFNNWKNPTYGEQIAQAFKREYAALRDGVPELHPDEIFGRLEAWAGGTANTTPAHKAAVLAVMAYLFDKCEIFEDARAMGAA